MELMVAILLLAIVASYVAFTIPITASNSVRTDALESTSALAYRTMETVKDKFKDDPDLFNQVTEDSELPSETTSDITYDQSKYSITTLVQDVTETSDSEGNSEPTLVTVKITVSPTDSNNTSSPEVVSVTTKIYKEQ